MVDPVDAAVDRIVDTMLTGNLAAINELAPALRSTAQQRYNVRAEQAEVARLEATRRNPAHADPAAGLL